MTLAQYAAVVWRSRWLVIALMAMSLVAGVLVAAFQPRIYSATATAMPPKESAPQALSLSLGSLLGGGVGGAAGGVGGAGGVLPALNLGGGPMTSDIILAIMKSRTMKEEVLAEARKALGRSVGSELESVLPDIKGRALIAITVEARDPKIAAFMANKYFEHLNAMMDRHADRAAKRMEEAYVTQLERSADAVREAEAAVIKFQKENNFLVAGTLDAAGGKGGVDAGAMARGQIMALELQRDIMRTKMTDQHPQMRDIEAQIAGLKKVYSKNLFGSAMDLPAEGAGGKRREYFVAAEQMTPTQFAFLKVYRNLKIQEAFHTGAMQALEQMKYGDAANRTAIEILDPAMPPGRPIKPNVQMVVGAAVGIGAVTGIALALLLEYLRRLGFEPFRRRVRARSTGSNGRNGHTLEGVAPAPGSVAVPRPTPR